MKWALLLYFSSLDYVDTSLRYDSYSECYKARDNAVTVISNSIALENEDTTFVGVKKMEKIARMEDDLAYAEQLRCVVADNNS